LRLPSSPRLGVPVARRDRSSDNLTRAARNAQRGRHLCAVIRERARSRSEEGAELVEFAIVTTVLLALVFGMIGFGLTINSDIGLNNAVREGARNGAVATYAGNNTVCATLAPAAAVACFVRADSGLSAPVPVEVVFPPTYAVGQEMIVCATYPMTNIAGFLAPFLGGRYLKAKVKMRLEQAPGNAPANYTTDTDPSGSAWSWCS